MPSHRETLTLSSQDQPEKTGRWHDRIRAARNLTGRIATGRLDFSRTQGNEGVRSIETRGYAKTAPHLQEQVEDAARDNLVESAGAYRDPTVRKFDVPVTTETVTETEGLKRLNKFFLAGEACDAFEAEDRRILEDMRERLAFIGEREMDEATAGLAAYWKDELDHHQNLQFLIQVIESIQGQSHTGRSGKSAGLVVRKVLDHFTDEDLEAYRGRIIFDPRDATDDMTTRAVLLDDWTISGTQLRQMEGNLHYYDGIDECEVDLVVAPETLVAQGLQTNTGNRIPVKAYYQSENTQTKAHVGKAVWGDIYPGYITGAHSSVDLNFDHYLAAIVKQANEKAGQGKEVPDILRTMPPLTQVTRPYRGSADRHHRQVEKINELNGRSYIAEDGGFVFGDRD